jgi:hypothetical protein
MLNWGTATSPIPAIIREHIQPDARFPMPLSCRWCSAQRPGARGLPEESSMYRVMLLNDVSGQPALFCTPACYDEFRIKEYKMNPLKVAHLAYEKQALRKAWAFKNACALPPTATSAKGDGMPDSVSSVQ